MQVGIMAALGITIWNDNRVIDFWFINFTLPRIPIELVPIAMVSLVFLWFIWGIIDQKVLKLQQAESAYGTDNLNPHLRKMGEDILEIKKRILKYDKTD